jgi:NAD-dependent deacetylase
MKICVLTGAGISAESGIKTFRDSDGLWEGHDVMEVATPQGFAKNPALVLDFYNQRRAQLHTVEPNAAHKALAMLEKYHEVVVITQNVDDLHERGGSQHIIHLHGELLKSRSILNDDISFDCQGDINIGDLAPDGGQLRPHIVWFGEQVPMLELAVEECYDAEILIIIGTSLQVYPAASLVQYVPRDCMIYYIDPKPQISLELSRASNLKVIAETAVNGLPVLVDELIK